MGDVFPHRRRKRNSHVSVSGVRQAGHFCPVHRYVFAAVSCRRPEGHSAVSQISSSSSSSSCSGSQIPPTPPFNLHPPAPPTLDLSIFYFPVSFPSSCPPLPPSSAACLQPFSPSLLCPFLLFLDPAAGFLLL